MKTIRIVKRYLSFVRAQKRLVVLVVMTLCLFAGVSVYAYHQYADITKTATTSPSLVKTKPSQSPHPPATPSTTTPIEADKQQDLTPIIPSPAPTTSQKQQKNTAQITPSPPSPSTTTTFSAGRIESAYTSCAYGALHYTLGSVMISSNSTTGQSFTWQVELNDGTIFTGATTTMPSGSSVWFNFPSTPTYPSMFGTIENANDGDKARLVITSPNYSAGGWSDPVPVGSEERCQNGQM